MTDPGPDEEARRERLMRGARVGAALAVAGLLAFAVWRFASDTAGEKREVPQVPVVALTPPPPPPPPPPPKPQPPEPQKTVETPQPTPSPQPKAPSPKNDAPKQLTINGPAQAGTDAFGVAAGSGGGVAVGGDPNGSDTPGGGGFGEANYARYLKTTLQQAVQSDEKVSHLFFAAQVNVWIGADGRITRVSIAHSSGDREIDRALVDALQQVGRLDEPPPPQLRFPAHIELRGRRA